MVGQGRDLYTWGLSFPLPKHFLVFSMVCLHKSLFPLLYYIAMIFIVWFSLYGNWLSHLHLEYIG